MKASLSRQVSAASCSSAQFHLRNLHQKWMSSHLGKQQPASSPDQPARSHLDDDGMPVYTDVIQQRLRQIETGHQQEVETLKKQVQELRSRLESQFLNSSLRLNGDYGDEVVTRWLPDHLAAHCYGCDSMFWLASRKHHCRNCGNVFCSSCCNQKVPVPSQQLFEPSRVCKSCYSSLHPSSSSLDLELDKPITATSN
uniref:phosphatidylinositol-3,5-bisphosphate 3-phosphatase n=2 Tax=Nothoprocta perdicaria TaxID=30464 RepID=A0A8C7E849_NOTPE